ncbi:COX15/CtaA family protein [Chondrinema litorale]|uniref:COX15/CtaA family protein n=1 Tax=Chondrinema litorale TaxID=2994555 RepID=UPI00254326ED|nr:COX15/CtaA family protein [Chondrinema litorale]UZR93683.1 COX15/CtaA family protein [Chondrinema litorale]
MKKSEKRFRNFGVITIVSVYVLILVGGIVRATGSGMGCPDWPKCFGQWVPPTNEAELPENYKEVFKVAGKEIADFNVIHTWTEYVNRLVGSLIGVFILVTCILSISFYKKDKLITVLSFITFLIVLFQGWLGSVVVSTNLKPILITLHMLLAQVIVGILLFVIFRSFGNVLSLKKLPEVTFKKVQFTLLICIALSVIQLMLGTQVREGVDVVAKSFDYQQRNLWLEEIGAVFYTHRSFSLLVLAVHAYFFFMLFKSKENVPSDTVKWAYFLGAILLTEILSGIGMAYFSIPNWLQPVHLLLGSLALGVQFILLLFINFEKFLKKQKNLAMHTA